MYQVKKFFSKFWFLLENGGLAKQEEIGQTEKTERQKKRIGVKTAKMKEEVLMINIALQSS